MNFKLAFLSLILVLAGCSKKSDLPYHEEMNAAYYWKTTFRPDSAEMAFLRQHNVGRIYLRMFDVDLDGEMPVPNATVRFGNSPFNCASGDYNNCEFLESLNVVPTVYITLDAMRRMKGEEGKWAQQIVTRVKNMCSYNEIPNVSELQYDCDWTASTEKSFFALCDSTRQCIENDSLGWDMSSTIRLHQLNRQAPPVGRGVLMVYNTGSFNNPDIDNSILSTDDVVPYLSKLGDYPLHLDIAYPTYSWQLLFHKRQFAGLLSTAAVEDSTLFEKTGDNRYTARREHFAGNSIIREGDVVRVETSEFATLAKVKSLIEQKLVGRPHSNIVYHIDSLNLSKYSEDEISEIYTVAQ